MQLCGNPRCWSGIPLPRSQSLDEWMAIWVMCFGEECKYFVDNILKFGFVLMRDEFVRLENIAQAICSGPRIE
ncbi:unnamed protein product [Brugia pahangi]|uniref:Uncharacterized protein n=1 Tax=Brugia pahangi TaxID=6280 RepID=A0A0N4TQ53_BRUPA|nr:unnamed protein product [Brugia pahangi]